MEASVSVGGGPADYGGLIDQVTSMVTAMVPPAATVLMVSKGDERLLQLGSRSGWHFPRLSDGRYAGHYPADSEEAIAQLETLHERGAGYIVFPATAMWWLDHYPDFSEHLESRYQCLIRDDRICAIYAFGDPQEPKIQPPTPTATDAPATDLEVSLPQLTSFLDSILPEAAIVAVVSSGDAGVLGLPGRDMWHFPRDPSGRYSGLGPANTDVALDQLEGLRARGLEFLVIPRETPWLSHYPEFVERVEERYRCVGRQKYLCTVYDLAGSDAVGREVPTESRSPWRRWLRPRSGDVESE